MRKKGKSPARTAARPCPLTAESFRGIAGDAARIEAVRALAPGNEDALPVLLSALRDPNDYVRLEAARALGRLSPASPSVAHADGLLAALGDGNAFVRAEAYDGLKALPRAVVAAARPPDSGAGPEDGTRGRGFVDCLGRVAVDPLPEPVRCERCIGAVVSPGFAGYLDDFLATLARHGDCPDARVVVFSVDGDEACRRTIARHGAAHVPCRSLTHVNAASKGVLYSAARVVEAEKYLCLDTDVFVTGSLRPLFDALDVCHERSVLVCRSAPWDGGDREFRSLPEAVRRNYGGAEGDVAFLTGSETPDVHFFKANSGVYAGRRTALLALDAAIRRLQPFASAWIDAGGHGRDELVFSLALGRLKAATEISGAYNVQLYGQDVECREEGGRTRFYLEREPARVLHFATPYGRSRIAEFRGRVGLPPA